MGFGRSNRCLEVSVKSPWEVKVADLSPIYTCSETNKATDGTKLDLNIGETRVWWLDSGLDLQPWKCTHRVLWPHFFCFHGLLMLYRYFLRWLDNTHRLSTAYNVIGTLGLCGPECRMGTAKSKWFLMLNLNVFIHTFDVVSQRPWKLVSKPTVVTNGCWRQVKVGLATDWIASKRLGEADVTWAMKKSGWATLVVCWGLYI